MLLRVIGRYDSNNFSIYQDGSIKPQMSEKSSYKNFSHSSALSDFWFPAPPLDIHETFISSTMCVKV